MAEQRRGIGKYLAWAMFILLGLGVLCCGGLFLMGDQVAQRLKETLTDLEFGSGIKATETRTVGEFRVIEVHGSPNVTVTVGGERTVRVETDDNLLAIILTELKGESLVIRSTKGYSTQVGVNVFVTVPSLDGIEMRGSGDAKVDGVAGGTFKVKVVGSGDIVATGVVDELDLSIVGSGDADLGGLQARSGRVSVMGSGDADVHVTEKLDVSIMGSGDVSYRGDPDLTQDIAGSGDVRRR